MLTAISLLFGVALIGFVLLDAFGTIVLPRTANQRFRLTRLFYGSTWRPWAALGRRIKDRPRQERFLGVFGPLSLLGLLAVWATLLIVGFGLIQWRLGIRQDGADATVHGWNGFWEAIYFSGTTFFTLGLGDVKPETVAARTAEVLESGIGFGFLALVIGYLPVVYAAFSRREMLILRLDVRAGSPPSAGELLRQHANRDDMGELDEFLRECEAWAAELLESHLSYPTLCLYRSQHLHQSWLASLTTILDASALLVVGLEGVRSRQAPMTFAMARRAMVDIAHHFQFPDDPLAPDRLPPEQFRRLRETLAAADSPVRDYREGEADAGHHLARLRATYEPSAHALAKFTLMPLPPWVPAAPAEETDCTGVPPVASAAAAERLTADDPGESEPALV